MAIVNIATDCLDDLREKMGVVPWFKNNVLTTYTQEALMDKTTALQYPAAGVLYQGLRAVPDADKSGKGLSGELTYNIVLLCGGTSLQDVNYQNQATTLLDEFRNAIKSTRSPTGNFWKFVIEAPVEAQAGLYVYVQRWATAVLLTV